MRSSNRSGRPSRFLLLLLIAALVIVSRMPFLVHGDRFFDSDEAVEGLMARHVLQGEHPAFLWGQRYKGVPEVYLAAAAFAVTGPGVVALKSVTLVCFAIFVCVQFVLVERLFSRPIAWMATAFLILCPPSLVLWSLSGNAEIVLTMLAGTVICLGIDLWRRTGSRTAFLVACTAAGFGFWVHQYITYYIVAIALAVLYHLPKRRELIGRFISARDMSAWARLLMYGVAVVALGYVVLGMYAFLTGGFDLKLFAVLLSVHHPQKAWNIAVGLLLLCAAGRVVSLLALAEFRSAKPMALLSVAAFAVGYAPALAGRVAGGGSTPIARVDFGGVAAAMSPVVGQIVPIVLGFRSPTIAWLGVPLWLGLVLLVAIVASFLALGQRPFTPLFHFLLVTTPLIFLLSGAYVDAQSYRYLMPIFGAFSVVLALGVWRLFRWSRLAGGAALAVILALFVVEQRAWYQQLAPDLHALALIDCLDRAGVRAAYADYWLSYKLTFLSDERIIVAPNTGVDRYLPFSTYVRAQPSAPTIPAIIGPSCVQDISSPR